MFKICGFCGKAFEVNEKNHDEVRRKYCSDTCRCDARNKQNADRIKVGKQLYNVECEVCGKVFATAYSLKATCSPKCKNARHRKMVNANNRKRREAIRNGTLPKPNRKKQKKVEPIPDFNKKAREMDMSYGQYDAYLRIQAMRKERAQNGGC